MLDYEYGKPLPLPLPLHKERSLSSYFKYFGGGEHNKSSDSITDKKEKAQTTELNN